MSQYVTIVNRTQRDLQGVWNGRQWKIPPGKSSFPKAQAIKFKEQNPIMGTQDPFSLECKYLIGIEEQQDDCSPVEQSNAIELTDRSKLNKSEQDVEVITGQGMYRPRIDAGKPLPGPDVNFVKP
jgi:hypothetical protein